MPSDVATEPPVGDIGGRLVLGFGWGMLGLLFAFLLNNFLTVWFDWPGPSALSDGGLLTILQLALYPATLGVIYALLRRRGPRSLRHDGRAISAFNAFLIRGAFWSVVLIGVTDATISFLRVEGFLEAWVGADLTSDLGRSQFRGPYVHMPLLALGFLIGAVTRALSFFWLALLIVMAELAIVITRFVFSYEQAFMGDLVRFWYAALFLFASAYTLIQEGHVRVDVFYTNFRPRLKGRVNAVGSVLLGMTVCWTILIVGMDGKSAILNSPMVNYEVSQSGFGMYVKYLMAGFLGLFAITMLIEFVSYFFEAVADMRDEPGRREIAAPSAH